MAASLEQSTRREKSLEEQGRRVTQERDDALHLIKELRGEERAVVMRLERAAEGVIVVRCLGTIILKSNV